jgi:6-phosphogluconolactonase/glucosamine-6-phosphate isomerase/deaminase
MGAELVYEARHVTLLASGRRKTRPVGASLLMDPTPDIPISYGQRYSERGGNLLYVVDKIAGQDLLAAAATLKKKSIALKDLS